MPDDVQDKKGKEETLNEQAIMATETPGKYVNS